MIFAFAIIINFTSVIYGATNPTLVTKLNTAMKKILGYLETLATPIAGVAIATGVLMRKLSFGDDEKMNDALHAINSFGERFLPRDAYEALCSSPQGIQSMYKMMQSMEPEVQTESNSTKSLSDSDLRRMMRDPKYWRDNDVEYIRKIENGFKKLYS